MRPPVRLAALLLLPALLAACRSQGPSSLEAALPRLDGSSEVALATCPTPKCLTVYVAPWCGVCRASTGLIAALKAYLRERGVAARVVVGRDDPANVRSYAGEFGPDTLLDPDGAVDIAGGVPQFIVTDAAGRVLKRMPGVPGLYKPPYSEDLLRQFAEYLELTR